MNNKKLLYLSAALAVLLALFFISRSVDNPVQKSELLVKADTTQIDSIYIDSPVNGITALVKKNDAWKVGNPPEFDAEARSIHTMLEKITEMKVENVASNLLEKQLEYKTDDSSAVKVKFFSKGKKVGEFLMGNLSMATRRHTFFRRPGSKETLMVKGNYNYHFNRKLKDWRNKDIMTLNPEGVQSMKLMYMDHQFTVTQKDSIWMVDDGKKQFEATKKSVEPMLNYLSRLRAGDFFNPDSSGGIYPDFGKPYFRLELTFTDGAKDGLSLVPEDDEQRRFYIRRDTDNTIYYIYKGTAQVLMKDLQDFRFQEEPQRPGTKNPRMNNE